MEDIIKARQDKKVLHIKSILNNTPEWKDFLYLLTTRLNDAYFYNKFDPIIFQAIKYENGIFDNYYMPSAKPFTDMFTPILNKFEVKAIMNLVGDEAKYWVHKDDHEVISWHCQGTMEWRIYPNLRDENIDKLEVDEPYDSYILEPGDLIYVPTGVGHQIVAPSPRASLILQIHNESLGSGLN